MVSNPTGRTKSLTNKIFTIMAKAIFYNTSTDCTLAEQNSNGGITYHLFEKVSDMVKYCRDNGIEATLMLED